MSHTYNVYWWREVKNFGDMLTHTILNSRNIQHRWAPPETAELVLAGSILEHLPCCWPGTVIGAGALYDNSELHLFHTDIRAVRGPLTAKLLPKRKEDIVLGDPGLLATSLVDQQRATHDLGVLPHWSDTQLYNRFPYGHLIDPRNGPIYVITEIARCKRLISSSLHGIIVADAFGIPRQAELPASASKEGKGFKFYDYAASINTTPQFGKLVTPHPYQIEQRQKELKDVLAF